MHADELPRSQFGVQFRVGRVSSVDAEHHRAQVQFFEGDGFVSWDMAVLVNRSGDYWLPTKDTPVVCLIVDGRLGVGYVLGAIYTDSDAAPLSDAGKRAIVSDDLRLGAADASDKLALAPKCNDEHNAIKGELDKISATLASLTGQAAFGTAYTNGYDPSDVDAEKVSGK